MIILKYPTLISSNNANERVWKFLTGLDEVFTSCNSVHLLIICETLWTAFTHTFLFPRSWRTKWQIISLLMCDGLWSSVHECLKLPKLSIWWPPTPGTIFNLQKCMRQRSNSLNRFKDFVCFCSCFPACETKLDAYLLLNNNREKCLSYERLLLIS